MEYVFGKNTVDSFIDSNMLLEVYLIKTFDDKKILSKIKDVCPPAHLCGGLALPDV